VRETVVSRSPPQYGSYQNTTSPAYTAGYSYRTTPVYDSYQTTLSQPHTQYVKWTPNNVSTWGPTLGEGINRRVPKTNIQSVEDLLKLFENEQLIQIAKCRQVVYDYPQYAKEMFGYLLRKIPEQIRI